jgi:hypothetical protein
MPDIIFEFGLVGGHQVPLCIVSGTRRMSASATLFGCDVGKENKSMETALRTLPCKGIIHYCMFRHSGPAHRTHCLVDVHLQNRIRFWTSHEKLDVNHRIFRVGNIPKHMTIYVLSRSATKYRARVKSAHGSQTENIKAKRPSVRYSVTSEA